MLRGLIALQLLTVAAPDPFAFFSPTVAISTSDRHRLLGGEPIAALKKSAYVLAIRRFSNPPRLSNLADLTLADEDLTACGHAGLASVVSSDATAHTVDDWVSVFKEKRDEIVNATCAP